VTALFYPPRSAVAAVLASQQTKPSVAPTPLVLVPLPPPVLRPVIRPSSAAEHPAQDRTYDTAAESLLGAEAARQSGIALHALLQHLGRVAPADRQKVVDKALAVLLPEAPERHAALGAKAMSILAKPEFVGLFGPDSRAEVPFLLDATRNGAPVRLAGRIDRIVVANGHVMVVDYKSDAVPAGTPSEVPASYVTQVGLYAYVASQLFPELVVEAGILWTTLESLMILPSPLLRDAVSAFTMR
jgi:ATP-dependent helicase/nuclease subunit A